MTQQEKELLLKDLCARLPYKLIIQVYYEDMSRSGVFNETLYGVEVDSTHVNDRNINNIKPYLRPMSSMTKEEHLEFINLSGITFTFGLGANFSVIKPSMIDWLNSHHFDYRGLIEKGLALDAGNHIYSF